MPIPPARCADVPCGADARGDSLPPLRTWRKTDSNPTRNRLERGWCVDVGVDVPCIPSTGSLNACWVLAAFCLMVVRSIVFPLATAL